MTHYIIHIVLTFDLQNLCRFDMAENLPISIQGTEELGAHSACTCDAVSHPSKHVGRSDQIGSDWHCSAKT